MNVVKNVYSFSEIIKNAYALVMTKFTMRQARLVRRPIYIRGKRSIVGGTFLTTGRFCRFDLSGNLDTLFIGKNCEMGDMTHIVAHKRVVIGDNVLIASKCFISDTSHGIYKGDIQDGPETPPRKRLLKSLCVVIGNNVWIGENVVVLPGAEIGDGCIIGANSIVSKKIPPNSMVVGENKIIKKWNEFTRHWDRT